MIISGQIQGSLDASTVLVAVFSKKSQGGKSMVID